MQSDPLERSPDAFLLLPYVVLCVHGTAASPDPYVASLTAEPKRSDVRFFD